MLSLVELTSGGAQIRWLAARPELVADNAEEFGVKCSWPELVSDSIWALFFVREGKWKRRTRTPSATSRSRVSTLRRLLSETAEPTRRIMTDTAVEIHCELLERSGRPNRWRCSKVVAELERRAQATRVQFRSRSKTSKGSGPPGGSIVCRERLGGLL